MDGKTVYNICRSIRHDDDRLKVAEILCEQPWSLSVENFDWILERWGDDNKRLKMLKLLKRFHKLPHMSYEQIVRTICWFTTATTSNRLEALRELLDGATKPSEPRDTASVPVVMTCVRAQLFDSQRTAVLDIFIERKLLGEWLTDDVRRFVCQTERDLEKESALNKLLPYVKELTATDVRNLELGCGCRMSVVRDALKARLGARYEELMGKSETTDTVETTGPVGSVETVETKEEVSVH